MKLIKLCFLLFFCLLIFSGCEKNNVRNGDLQEMYFGKDITITVLENEIVDDEYLQKVLEGKIQKDMPGFDMLNEKEILKLIEYMSDKNYVITPGRYVINQAWGFSDGKFVLNNGEEREILKFVCKE